MQPVKLEAVREFAADQDLMKHAKVIGVEVASGVSEQPLSLNETVHGAKTRALSAWSGAELSIGIECGVMTLAESEAALMQVCACCMYDGEDFCFGLSPAFELPPFVAEKLRSGKYDLNEAMRLAGFTEDERIGSFQGAIGILSQGTMMRKEFIKHALHMAFMKYAWGGRFH